MTTQSQATKNKELLVNLFHKFMIVNKKFKFSSVEITDIVSQLTKILNVKTKYSCQTMVKVLEAYGIKDVLQKHSKSCRSKLWFVRPLNPITLKVAVNA